MSLRDVTIARDGKRGYRNLVTSRTGSARRILGDFVCRVKNWTPNGKDRLSLAHGGLWQVGVADPE